MATKTVTLTYREMAHGIAQGAINIAEGLTTIEPGSQVHRAMLAFCEWASEIEDGKRGLPQDWMDVAIRDRHGINIGWTEAPIVVEVPR